MRRFLLASMLAASSIAGVPRAERNAAGSPPATVSALAAAASAPADDSAARSDDTRPIRIVAVGDLALAWNVGHGIAHEGFDPFAEVHDTIASADLAFANLETVLSTRSVPPRAPEAFPPLIVGPPDAARAVGSAGFDVVSVANNHAFDLHADGLDDTLVALRDAHVAAVGGGDSVASAREPVVVTVRGFRIGILAFAYGTNELAHGRSRIALLDEHAVDSVRELRPRVDIVLVSLHWGIERTHVPRPSQIALAHALVDAGADAIIGHHPHVLQSIEAYAGHVIAYSLGNFVFGPQPEERRPTGILELEWSPRSRRIERASLLPVRLDGPRGSPRRVVGDESEDVQRIVREASAAVSDTRFVERGQALVIETEPPRPSVGLVTRAAR